MNYTEFYATAGPRPNINSGWRVPVPFWYVPQAFLWRLCKVLRHPETFPSLVIHQAFFHQHRHHHPPTTSKTSIAFHILNLPANQSNVEHFDCQSCQKVPTRGFSCNFQVDFPKLSSTSFRCPHLCQNLIQHGNSIINRNINLSNETSLTLKLNKKFCLRRHAKFWDELRVGLSGRHQKLSKTLQSATAPLS